MKQLNEEEKKVLAKKLGTVASEIDELQKIANENWHLAVFSSVDNPKKFKGGMFYRHDSPSGNVRWLPLFTTKTDYETLEEATIAANAIREQIELPLMRAEVEELPQNIFILVDPLE